MRLRKCPNKSSSAAPEQHGRQYCADIGAGENIVRCARSSIGGHRNKGRESRGVIRFEVYSERVHLLHLTQIISSSGPHLSSPVLYCLLFCSHFSIALSTMAARVQQPSATSLARYATARAPDSDIFNGSTSRDYCNSFWGPGDAGPNIMFARMRGASKTTDELRNYWNERYFALLNHVWTM
jgi:hypothetical protein